MGIQKIDGWDRQEKSVIVIESDGVVVSDMVVKEDEDIEIGKKKKKLTPQQSAMIRNRFAIKEYTYELGGYIHMYYVNNELLFNKLNIDRADISRLIMMATFIDYNDREENLLVMNSKINNKIVHMTRKDIQYRLNLSDAPFKKFMSEMKKIGMIYEVDKKIYMSIEYFSKGKSDFKKKNYTRIFIDTVRTLYEGCKPRQHKQLGYIFQLVPFIHYDNNIICKNPNETDIRYCERMSLTEICSLLNIHTEASRMSKFEAELLKFTITYDERKFYLFKRIIVKGGNGKFDYFVINPQIVWSGKNMEQARETIESCFFLENKDIMSTLKN